MSSFHQLLFEEVANNLHSKKHAKVRVSWSVGGSWRSTQTLGDHANPGPGWKNEPQGVNCSLHFQASGVSPLGALASLMHRAAALFILFTVLIKGVGGSGLIPSVNSQQTESPAQVFKKRALKTLCDVTNGTDASPTTTTSERRRFEQASVSTGCRKKNQIAAILIPTYVFD